ncbi:MAG TPA: ABC transporter permease [Stellaceae bacterium]|nr:ABC transporter permease [Stellaceae bacterium]
MTGLLMPFVGVGALLLLWALITTIFKIPDYLLPSPISVIRRASLEWRILLAQTSYTLIEIVAGFLGSLLIGIPMAFAVVLSRPVERVVLPMVVASQAIPKVAIAPILVVWLGFGLFPKIVISFLIGFFPVLVSTITGLKSVETEMIDLVRSMGASTTKIMLRVRLPSALPQIFSGLKVAIALSVVGAIVGEFVGADRGLGYLLLTATGALDGTLVWAALLVLIGLGILLFEIVAAVERVAIRWHVSIRANDQQTFTS